MSKIIAIGDIHNKWALAQSLIERFQATHKIVLVGDYFDDFGDGALDADQTALWLKDTIQNPSVVALLGNHDINYHALNTRPSRVGSEKIYDCSGYTYAKDISINRILTPSHWSMIKVAHYENGVWFSHAGFHPFWFGKSSKMTKESISEKLKKIDTDLESHTFSNELCAAGRSRGGAHRVGGLLWRDHIQESYTGSYWNDTSGIRQVSGHTPLRNGIDIEELPSGGVCVNIDCGLAQVLEIAEDGSMSIIDTGFESFYKKQSPPRSRGALDALLNIGAYDDIMNSLNKS